MDLSATIIPKSDQLNAEDLLAGPLTVTVESVSRGNAEQPVDFHLVEYPGRAYRPSKTMRRVIVKAWGKESDPYAGRRMTLYRDPEVKFGGIKVGGIKISAMSHIDKAFSLALTETRGKRVLHTVEPLPNTPQGAAKPAQNSTLEPTAEQVDATADVDALKAMWRASGPERRAQIEARVHELTSPPAAPPVPASEPDEPFWGDPDADPTTGGEGR